MITEDELLAMITSGENTYARMVKYQREKGTPDRDGSGVTLSRQIDRALQKARRKGLVEYVSTVGWRRTP